jgi:3-dehydroquinate synthase
VTSRVRVEDGALSRVGAFVKRVTAARHVALVSDERVAALYGAQALRSLRRAGVAASLIVVPHGERSKSAPTLQRLWTAFADLELGRDGAVVAVGGGVVGDLAGLAAATWTRGVPWVSVPSTVMAQVDSSIGGKTGIDLPHGKNLVGAFHQPAGVLVDPRLLQTLPARERRSGLAEVIKLGMACDAALFAWAERHSEALAAGEPRALAEAVRRSIRVKGAVVMRDEFERLPGVRTSLNFGHTLGHALEAALGFRTLRHGEAVAIGMIAAARLSVSAAGLANASAHRLEALIEAVGLPLRVPELRVGTLLLAMNSDKKRAAGRPALAGGRARKAHVRWVLTPRVGHASVPRLISGRLVRAALLDAGARA